MLNVGNVIRLPFFPHQENKNEGECRFAIIIEDLQDKYLIVPLSCQTHQQKHHSNSFIILQNSNDGLQMKLTCDSLVMPKRVSQISKKFLKEKDYVGDSNDEMIEKILTLI